MHGIVLKGLKDFVVERHGTSCWNEIHERAGFDRQNYLPVAEYPDETAVTLFEATAEHLELDEAELCYEYGRELVPLLLSIYSVHVRRDWTAIDLIAQSDSCVESALQAMVSLDVAPPTLRSKQIAEDAAIVGFESDRRTCAVVRGMLAGVSEFFDEPLRVEERRCTRLGDPHCEFVVTRDARATVGEVAPARSWGRTGSTTGDPPTPVADGGHVRCDHR